MTKFAEQLQQMAEAAVNAAVQKEDTSELKKTLSELGFDKVKSYFNSMDNIVSIRSNNEEAFEIVLEVLKNKSSIETIKNDKVSMAIYSDSKVGYMVLVKIDDKAEYVFWNA